MSDRKEPIKYKGFKNIDDLMKLNEEENNLIQAENDIAKVAHQFKSAGRKPFVTYQVGMISQVKAKFRYKKLKKTIPCTIMAQNFVKAEQTVHSQVSVCSEDKYIRTVAEMSRFFFWKPTSPNTTMAL